MCTRGTRAKKSVVTGPPSPGRTGAKKKLPRKEKKGGVGGPNTIKEGQCWGYCTAQPSEHVLSRGYFTVTGLYSEYDE